MTKQLILVHGVAAERPGQFLESYLINQTTPEYSSKSAKAKITDHHPVTIVREVYWGDITGYRKLPGRVIASVARMIALVLKFLLGLSQAAAGGWNNSISDASAASWPATLLKFMLFSVAVPSPILFLMPLHYALLDGPEKWVLMAATVLPSLVISSYLRESDWACRLGLYVSIALAIITPFTLSVTRYDIHTLAGISAKVVGSIQLVVALLIVVSLFELIVMRRTSSIQLDPSAPPIDAAVPYLLKVFSITFPFALIGGALGALSWASNLMIAQRLSKDSIKSWSVHYQKALTYDLALLEATFATAMFLFGCCLVIVFWRYWNSLKKDRASDAVPLGRQFRIWLIGALWFYAILAVSVLVIYFADTLCKLNGVDLQQQIYLLNGFKVIFFHSTLFAIDTISILTSGTTGGPYDYDNLNALEIYGASAARIISFLPLLASGAALFVSTAADVLHWLLRPVRGSAGGIAESCRMRFDEAVEKSRGTKDSEVCIVAYSQGSIIALDAIKKDGGKFKLITIGSPAGSLYWQFLGIKLDETISPRQVDWINIYRASDFIGGEVSWLGEKDRRSSENYIENHMNYFLDAEVRRSVNNFLSTPLKH